MFMLLGALPKDYYIKWSIFRSGEQGIWLDPSDFSTLFQDAAGTTPVTAVGQPVGLALDKRLGLALGPELVTNGGFDSDTAWTDSNTGTGTAVISGGVLTLTGTDTSNRGRSYQALTVEYGKMYRVTLAKTGAAASVWVDTSLGGSGVAAVDAASASFVFLATAATVYLMFLTTSAGGTAVFDNISVREIAGNHAYQTTSASRPTVEARVNLLTYSEQLDNVAWFKSAASIITNAAVSPDGTTTADKVVEDTTTAIHRAYQAPMLSIGTTYVYRCYAKAAGRNWCYLANTSDSFGAYFDLANGVIGTVAGAGVTATMTAVGNGWYEIALRFTATSTFTKTLFCSPAPGNGGISYLGDGTSGIYLWGSDVRLASDSAYPYQRVNTATDYVDVGAPRYLSFDGTDDGMATPSIDFTGTDKMTVWAGVRKLSDAAAAIVVELSTAATSNSGTFYISAPEAAGVNKFTLLSRGTVSSSAAVLSATYNAPVTAIVSGIGDISGDSAIIRVNGVQAASSASDQGTGTYGNYPLYIGRRGGTTLPANMRLYQLIVRGAASNAGQIAATEAYVNSKTRAY